MSFGAPQPLGPLTIPATGTGSFYWTNLMGPWVSFQVLKMGGAATLDGIDFAVSNFSTEDVLGSAQYPLKTPLTSSAGNPGAWVSSSAGAGVSDPYSPYWFVDPTFSGTLMTGSATDASSSLVFDLGQQKGARGGMHSRVRLYSKAGGIFQVKMVVKAG